MGASSWRIPAGSSALQLVTKTAAGYWGGCEVVAVERWPAYGKGQFLVIIRNPTTGAAEVCNHRLELRPAGWGQAEVVDYGGWGIDSLGSIPLCPEKAWRTFCKVTAGETLTAEVRAWADIQVAAHTAEGAGARAREFRSGAHTPLVEGDLIEFRPESWRCSVTVFEIKAHGVPRCPGVYLPRTWRCSPWRKASHEMAIRAELTGATAGLARGLLTTGFTGTPAELVAAASALAAPAAATVRNCGP